MESKQYWNNRYLRGGNSGGGSYGEQLDKKMEYISKLSGVFSISEIGCGDFNFGKRVTQMFPEATYTGSDVSDVIVRRNTALYGRHGFTFNTEDVPTADLVLCVDVLFHVLDDKECEELINKLEKLWTKYLIVTAYERDEELNTHVRIRKFDYKRFGEPIVREVIEEDGSLYFYIFEK